MEGGKAEPGGPSTSPPRGGERDSRSACLPSASLEPAGFPPEEEPAAPLRPAVPHRILGGNGGGGCCSSSSLQAGSNRPCHQGRRRRRREEGGEEVRPLTLRNKGPGSGRRLRADSLMAAAAAQRRTPHAPSAGAAPPAAARPFPGAEEKGGARPKTTEGKNRLPSNLQVLKAFLFEDRRRRCLFPF